MLRPGAACSDSPRGSSGLGEPSCACFHACVVPAVFEVWKAHRCVPGTSCLAWCQLMKSLQITSGVSVSFWVFFFPFLLPGHLQITQAWHNHDFPYFRFLFRERFNKAAQLVALSPLWVTCTLCNRRMVAPPWRCFPPASPWPHISPTIPSHFPYDSVGTGIKLLIVPENGPCCKQREGKKTTRTDLLALLSHSSTK